MAHWISNDGDLMTKLLNCATFFHFYIFQDHKVIFKHFSRKISHFQGRLKNQTIFKTAFKFKHFSRSVGTMLLLSDVGMMHMLAH